MQQGGAQPASKTTTPSTPGSGPSGRTPGSRRPPTPARPPRVVASESALVGGLLLDALLAPFWFVLLIFGKARLATAARPLRRIASFLLSARMTAALIVANVTVFMWQISLLGHGMKEAAFRHLFALAPSDVRSGNWQPMPLHVFAHANLGHLVGNMLALFVFGRVVERHLGPWRLLVAYLGSALISTIVSLGAMVITGQDVPSLGASGAIAGTIALAILFEPFAITYEALVPMPLFVLGWAASASDVSGVFSGRHDGVDHAAHLGGYLSVLAIYFGLNAQQQHRAKVGLALNVVTAIAGVLLWTLWIGPTLAHRHH